MTCAKYRLKSNNTYFHSTRIRKFKTGNIKNAFNAKIC